MKGGRVSDHSPHIIWQHLLSTFVPLHSPGRFTNPTSSAETAPQTLLLPPKHLSSSSKAVEMLLLLLLRGNICLLQSELPAVLEQSSSGNSREGRAQYLAVINRVSSPAHHIQDVVGLLGLIVDAVQDAVHCTHRHREVQTCS